jgi:amidohydrolase
MRARAVAGVAREATMEREQIWALAEAQREFVLAARRHLHRHPELSFQEHETAAYVAAHLREMGYTPKTGLGRAGTGLIAVLEGSRPGPTLALRADMDALPVQELTDLPFRSMRDGVMHACGHDAHTAVLLGAARALMAAREEVPGRVVFLFQHAEESPPGGALELIAAGALDGVEAVFGLHQGTDLNAGQMGFTAGPRQASADMFTLTVRGRGGHGAFPHRAVDAVQVAALVVTALHEIVSRRVPPLQPAVLSIGSIHGGTAPNVIAHEVTLTGTVRALDAGVRDLMPAEIERVAHGVASAWGAEVALDYRHGYPVLVNDPTMTEVARRAAEIALGPENVVMGLPPVMAGEDFAYYLERVPGCLATLGAGTPGVGARGPSHSGTFVLDEGALPCGVAYYLALVTNFTRLRAK